MATDYKGNQLHRNDIAKVSNAINNFQLHSLSKNEIKAFWTMISQMANQSDAEILHYGIHFSFKEIAELSGFKHLTKKRLYDLIRNMFAHLAQTLFIEEKKDANQVDIETTMFTPLKKIKIASTREDVWVKANEEMIPFLHKLQETYTAFELKLLMTLNSRYSLRLYTILMQWRTTGKVILSKKFFYEIMDVPQSYKKPNRTSAVDARIIVPAIKELNEKKLVTNLTYEKKYSGAGEKGGRSISQYIFTFNPQKLNPKLRDEPNGKFKKVKDNNAGNSAKHSDDGKQKNKIVKQQSNTKNKNKNNNSNNSGLNSLVGNIFD